MQINDIGKMTQSLLSPECAILTPEMLTNRGLKHGQAILEKVHLFLKCVEVRVDNPKAFRNLGHGNNPKAQIAFDGQGSHAEEIDIRVNKNTNKFVVRTTAAFEVFDVFSLSERTALYNTLEEVISHVLVSVSTLDVLKPIQPSKINSLSRPPELERRVA